MKPTLFASLLICLFSIRNAAQWNTDLSVNLSLSETARIENVIYDGNGYYFTWQEGMGPFSHVVTRLNLDGSPDWQSPILAHNHDLGSFTVSLQHSAVDSEHNFIRVSSYVNDNGEFCCINKINTAGEQLLNGEAGVEFTGMAMGFALGTSGNMYLLVNSDLKKIDPAGNVLWSTALDPDHPNNREADIIESPDGTVGVAYFVPGMGNPVYGKYYISRFDASGIRTTVGSQLISPATCSFYRPSFFTINDAGEYFFIGHDTNSSVSFVQHLIGDVPQIGGNGTPLDNAANSSFITATVSNDTLYAFYQYDWNSFDEGGMKMQAITMATGTTAYDLGVNLYNSTDGIRPLQNSALDLNGIPACLIVESPSNVVRLLEYGPFGVNTYPMCTSSAVKSQAAVTTFHQLNSNQKQLIMFLEDYRTASEYPSAIAQNLVLDSPGLGVSQAIGSTGMMMYPNPAHHSTRMQIDNEWLGSACNVFDQFGRKVDSFTISQCTMILDTRQWPVGIYHVNITNGTERLCRLLIIE
jgi:hypothetical protein